MLPDSVDAEGRLNVTTDLPDASSTIVGGVAVNAEGQIHITNVISDLFVNGLMVTDLGQLCFSAAPIDGPYLHGFPRKADGRLVGQADTTPDPKDPFVAGIRVGALGGIYSTYVAPPVGDVPVNVIAPDVTGDAIVGATLTCSTGTWTGTTPITYTYRWYQGATPIIGATNSTYVTQAGDLGSVLICAVTATNALGAATAFSNGIRMVNARYNYRNNAGIPAAGMISAGSASAPLQLRIYETDLDGVNHSGPFSRMEAGDSIFINGQEGYLTEAPIDAGNYYICEMLEWPALPDGEYLVQLGYANENTLADEVRQIFAKYGADAHMWLPGIGLIDGFTAGNWLDSGGTTPATVDNPVGKVDDAAGAIDATQGTTANKPILRRGAVNLCLQSNDISTSPWTVAAATIVKDQVDRNGITNGAWRITNPATSNFHVSQIIVPPAGSTVTLSFYAKSNGGTKNYIGIWDRFGTTLLTSRDFTSELSVSEFRRISITATLGAGSTSVYFYLTADQAIGTVDVIIQDVQIEIGSTASTYIPTTTAAASSSTGNYAWQFDGTNDTIQCSSSLIENTGNDYAIISGFKAGAIADKRIMQVRDASTNLIYIATSPTNEIILQHLVGGLGGGSTPIIASGYSLNENLVVSGVRRSTELRLRKNGGVLSSTTTPQTGSNAIAANMFIGCQQGTSMYFLGEIYPQIIIKGTVTDADLSVLERFVAGLSGVTL